MPHLSPSTLGHLQDDGYTLRFYCEGENPRCNRTLDLDLDRCIELWGRDVPYIEWSPPVKCSRCGSKKISMRLTPGAYRPPNTS